MMAMTLEQEIPDSELAARAAAGDRDSFSRLVSRHYDFVFRVAYRLTGHRADAEDVAQEVCVRIGRAIGDYRGGGRFTTWLYAMTLNGVRDLARSRSRDSARTRAFAVHALVDGEAGPVDDGADQADRLWEAVRSLSPKQRDAVTLVYGEGLSHADAADAMACSEPTVSWHIHEAKKRLKTIMSAGEV